MADDNLRAALGNDIFWLLAQMAQKQPKPITTLDMVPHVADSLFWDVFTAEHPDSPVLFANAGLFLPCCGDECAAAALPSDTRRCRRDGWLGWPQALKRVDKAYN